MLQWVIDLVQSIDFARIVLVLGAKKTEIEAKLQVSECIDIVDNPDWRLGQSSSVRKGVELLEKDCDAIMFFLGDQPFITKALVEREIEVYTESKPEILVPVFDGTRGNPVIFSKNCFSELRKIHGDQGGRAIFRNHPIYELSWSNVGENRDIDNSGDLGGQ